MILALVLFLPALCRRKSLHALALIALTTVGIATLFGCGATTSAQTATILRSSAGVYVVTISGTTTGSATPVSATTTMSLAIN